MTLLVLATIGMTALPIPDDHPEPEKYGRPLSEWIRLLDSPDPGVPNNAATILMGFGEAAAPATSALARVLACNASPDARRHSAIALGEIGVTAKSAADALARATADDENISVRIWSARSLARVEPGRTDEALKHLLRFAASDEAGLDRAHAIDGLARLGAAAKSALPDLKTFAKDADPEVAKAAREALQTLDPVRSGRNVTAPASPSNRARP